MNPLDVVIDAAIDRRGAPGLRLAIIGLTIARAFAAMVPFAHFPAKQDLITGPHDATGHHPDTNCVERGFRSSAS